MSDAGERYVDDYYSMLRLDEFLYLVFGSCLTSADFHDLFDRVRQRYSTARRRRFNDWERGIPEGLGQGLRLDDRPAPRPETGRSGTWMSGTGKERHTGNGDDYFSGVVERSARAGGTAAEALRGKERIFAIPEREIWGGFADPEGSPEEDVRSRCS